MCIDPVSMMVIGTVASAGSQLVGGMSSMSTANSNAKALQQQAYLREQKGEYDVEQADRRFRREQGKVLAGLAVSGVDASSFYDVLNDNASESALEKKTIRYGATADANNLRHQAMTTKAQGKAAFIGSIFSAAGTVASGYGKVGAMQTKGVTVDTQYGGY